MSEHNIQSDSSGEVMKVTLLGDGWTSSTGGLATLNRELAIQLAQHPKVDVCLLVPDGHCTDEDKSEAKNHGIRVVSAKKRPGYDKPLDWLCAPPEGHRMDIVVGHGVNLGRQVQFIKDSARFHNCKWVQVVHTAPEDLSKYKGYSDRISIGEKKHEVEVELCKLADLIVPVGPRLEEVYSSCLQRYKRDTCIFPVIPGLFDREFGGLEQSPNENAEFKVLLCGRADEEDFELKGYNLAAKAFIDHRLQRKRFNLIFVGAPEGKQDVVRQRLLECGIAEEQLTVKAFVKSREKMKDLLCEVDLAIMPSRSEGFGLVALEALSAGLPILVNSKSGFARALVELPCSDLFIVNSDEPAKWAEAIEGVCISHRKRLTEITLLRTSYDNQYSWKKQCGNFVEKLQTMVHGSCNDSARLPEGESFSQQQSVAVASLEGFYGQQGFCNGEKKGSGANQGESSGAQCQQRTAKQNTSGSTFDLGPHNGCLKIARVKLPLPQQPTTAASVKGLCGQQSFYVGVKKEAGGNENGESGVQSLQGSRKQKTSGSTFDLDTQLTVRIKISTKGLNGEQRREFEEFLLQRWQRFKNNNDICSAEGMGALIEHLIASRGLFLKEIQKGCLEITVECPTLDSLESLWNDYCCGQLNEILEKYLVTDEIKEKLNLENLRLQTTIPEEDYFKARTSFMEKSVTSIDLKDNQKRWVVIGICLNRLLLPVLRDFVSQEIPNYYTTLKTAHGIDTQVFPHHLPNDGPFKLNYGSINNNWGRYKKSANSYDYKVNSVEDLAKLYLEPHMAKFTGFDNTCDLSAVLGILANASVFHGGIQTSARDVRSTVRNKWGHCNFDHWTDLEFKKCFQLMETLVRSLALPKRKEDDELDKLKDWETKGLQLCLGQPVDKDLINLISGEVSNLEKEVENIKNTSTVEANKISNALLTIRDEIDNFEKRISDILRRMEEQQKEQLEKEKELSGVIEDITSDLTKLGKRQDANEVDISMLEKRKGQLETTVLSMKDEQCSLNLEVGALKIEQARLDSRMGALEKGTSKASSRTKIAQVPSRNLCFCGRDSQLEAIAVQLRNTGNGCVHSAICGLGGVGKTSLAVEFLCRYEEEYPGGIFWISGENTNNFQVSLGELAHQIGTLENDFSNTLSKTIAWLTKQEELWCLVVDNLDELEMPTGMKKLLTGHWKHTAHGHIIITTRREVVEIAEETGISDQCCIELKCLTEDEGIQFLQMRIGKVSGEESDVRELVRELDGLPLALDQAGAYMKFANESPKKYVRKYKEKKLALLKRKKARLLVENTSTDRLAVHTTWLLNFDHVSHFSEDMDLGGAPTLVMQVCAFFGPDDIPYELINDGLNKEDASTGDSSLWDQAEIVSLLTKFSLFQRYGTNSFSVHRLVQEVIRSHLEKEIKLKVLSCAVHILHFALVRTRSPAAVCERFVEDAVFSVKNPPSLHLWGKLASHATYLQEHLRNFLTEHTESVHALLYSEETMRVFNEAGIFFSVSQEKVKAQEMQQLKLDILVNLEKSTTEDGNKLPNYFIDIPLKDRNYKLISHCMRHPAEHDAEEEAHLSQERREDDANQLREQGNRAVKNKNFDMASNLYSSAIGLLVADYRLFFNRALCYLKLGRPQEALDDCEKCLALNPNYSKALQRKAWALQELIKNGLTQRTGQKKAVLAMALHFDPTLRNDHTFCEMFPEAGTLTIREVNNGSQLAFALMTAQANETLLLHEGKYNLNQFVAHTDLQIVGLGQGIILMFKEVFSIFSSRCYFENIVLPKGNVGLICQGKDAGVHMNHCEISGGYSSCEDYPECNGGPGCIAASLGKPVCDRTSKFGDSKSKSGVGGFPGVQILSSSALIEYCTVCDCGGGGILVVGDGSHLEVRGCEVYRNHQAGLEAREGGNLVASDNRIFNGGYHGILIGPNAGKCVVNDNKIFENAREGIFALSNKNKIVICNNDIHHNKPFGISLDDDSRLLISDNRIFENGFWGILAKSRTSANITRNIISGNKCGGIFIGVNFSGRVHLESNMVRDHSGPWLEYQSGSFAVDSRLLDSESFGQIGHLPPGENRFYSNPPVLHQNKEFNNEEGMYHPREVAGRVYNGCTFCHRSKDEVQCLVKCPICNIASYCCKDCRSKHWTTHKTLCIALKSCYSVTVKILPLVGPGERPMRTFGAHLKGTGTGPKPKRTSHQKFIVKIQTLTLNCHPRQLLIVYDKSLTIDCFIQSREILSIIMECGVLGALHKFTSKKVFLWAMYAEKGEKLTIFLDQLAPYQEW